MKHIAYFMKGIPDQCRNCGMVVARVSTSSYSDNRCCPFYVTVTIDALGSITKFQVLALCL